MKASVVQRLVVLILALRLGDLVQGAEAKLNFIVVLIDDMGWEDPSCFGNQDAQTPEIDRLAREGLRFSQFYVNAPICSPSRTALTTGCYPQRFRIGSYLDNRRANRRRGMANWLDPQAPTLPRLLHTAGYATGHFGKWHMGGQRDVGNAPLITAYGFDRSLTNFEGLGDRVLPLLVRPGETESAKYALGSDNLGHGNITWRDRSEITSVYVDAAIRFISEAAERQQPFYVNVWPDDVHSPFTPPLNAWGDGTKRTLYLAVLESMDRQLGKLFDHVRDDPQLRDNTLVLLCSDNGPEPGAGRAGEFRGGKGSLYEGGIRSPLIVWCPGRMKPDISGQWNRQSCFAAFDLVPSILDLAHVEPSDGAAFDGEVVTSALFGDLTAGRKEPLYFRRPPDRDRGYGQSDLPDLAVRLRHWKLLCEYDGSDPQLYNLENDPGESRNVAMDQAQLVTDLTRHLLEWHKKLPPDKGADLSKN